MKSEWKYMTRGQVKHYFIDKYSARAICGLRIHWSSLPRKKQQWHDDKEGLDQRKRCQTCLGVIAQQEIEIN